MKKTLLFSVALAGLMLGSCSSSDDLAGGNTPANQSGKGYVAFNINLPSQSGSSSRAGSENDQFDAGMKSEYDVKNATLLLFDGSDESSAQFKKAYPLNTAPWTDKGNTDNVTTTSATIVQQVDAPSTNYLALVVLNSNNVFTLGTDGGITIDGSAFSGTLNDFLTKSAATDGKDLTKAGFYMANAPLANKAGGSGDPSGATVNTLVSLDGKIKETEAEAKAAPAEIYVERGVAKVTMQKGTTTSVTGSKPASSTSEVAFEVNSWTLDNTNKTTYLVRSTKDYGSWLSLASNATTGVINKYRFVGSNEVGPGMYRTYFAQDPNYDKTGNASATFNSSATFSSEFGNENPQYCFENTFDVDNQIDKYTTRVLIKAKLNDGNTFYVINGDENTIFDRTAVEKEIKKQFLLEYDSWIKANVTSPTTVNESSLAVDFTDEAGAVTLNSIEITGATYVAGVTSLPSDYIKTVMARLGSIQEYKKGESYYFVRIKHFGDDLTPWNSTETDKPSAKGVYPSGKNRDGNYLGRYGVLRNNWYDIEVKGVKGLGSPKVPTVTTDTDDELKSYIAVKINVLSWAKRTQGAILH